MEKKIAAAIVSRLQTNKSFDKEHGMFALCDICHITFSDDGIYCNGCSSALCTDCYVKGNYNKAPFCKEKVEYLKYTCRDCVDMRYDNRFFVCACCNCECNSMNIYVCDNHGRVCSVCIVFAGMSYGVDACKKCLDVNKK